jgi:hypothetical protein
VNICGYTQPYLAAGEGHPDRRANAQAAWTSVFENLIPIFSSHIGRAGQET